MSFGDSPFSFWGTLFERGLMPSDRTPSAASDLALVGLEQSCPYRRRVEG
jgi:hypothetical protein